MKNEAFKKIEASLFLKDSEAAQQLTPLENERRKRWMWCISQKMDDPLMLDKDLVEQLEGYAGLFSLFRRPHIVICLLFEDCRSIQLSKNRTVHDYRGAKMRQHCKNDAKAMAAAIDKISKYTCQINQITTSIGLK